MNKETSKAKLTPTEQNERKSLQWLLRKPHPTLWALSIPAVHVHPTWRAEGLCACCMPWKVLRRKSKSVEVLTWLLPCTLRVFYVHSDSGTLPTPEVELASMFIDRYLCSNKLDTF